MKKYIIRLDDACPRMNICNWNRLEALLDKYNVKPLIGVIPNCMDEMMNVYSSDDDFWSKVKSWQNKGYAIAMHGYDHVYITDCGGINPVNKRSEFAGVDIEVQKDKIRKGVDIMRQHGINPKVFFAPSHTFDINTIKAIRECSDIEFISDTVACDVYSEYGITFVPQQSGSVRRLPFKTVTFCYHPNTMLSGDFVKLEKFLSDNEFSVFPDVSTNRKRTFADRVLERIYFLRRALF